MQPPVVLPGPRVQQHLGVVAMTKGGLERSVLGPRERPGANARYPVPLLPAVMLQSVVTPSNVGFAGIPVIVLSYPNARVLGPGPVPLWAGFHRPFGERKADWVF